MILIKKPKSVTEYINVSAPGGGMQSIGGQCSITDAVIVCPDVTDSKDLVWNKLKYGPQGELELGQQADKIEFPEEGIVLYGVLPYEIGRSGIFEGRVFTCKIAGFEEI